jgi:hypothetical protein
MVGGDAEERLDRALDRLTRGETVSRNGQSVPEEQVAARLHTLAAMENEAEPRVGFLPSLREELLMTESLRLNRIGTARAAMAPTVLPRTTAASRSRRLGAIGWISFVAVLALIAAGVYLLISGGGGSHDPNSAALPAAATPAVMAALPGEPVDISECNTAARPDGTVAGLIGQTPTHPPMLPKFSGSEPDDSSHWIDPVLLLGDHPRAETAQLAGITETMHEFTACRFYFNPVSTWNYPATPIGGQPTETYIGLDGRLFALFSDDFFRKEAKNWAAPGIQGPMIDPLWTAQGPLPWRVDDARQLPDGRVIASVEAPPGSIYATRMIVVFSEHDGRWLIDEFGIVQFHTAGSTRNPSYPQYLEIALQDSEGPSIASAVPSVDAFQNNRPITVTVANLGDVDQRFTIDRLGVDLVVPAGHSISFTLTPPVGKYVVESYVRNPTSDSFDDGFRRLQYVLRIVGGGTPVAMG